MSYEVYFRSRLPDRSISSKDFIGYFKSRRHYTLNESQAWYSNDETGVYFAFEHGEHLVSSDDEEQNDRSLLPVSFNLNCFRPHAFGLEAEPELSSFVEHFDLRVSDPQIDGMGNGDYSHEGFLRGWNAGNEFGYRAILSQNPDSHLFTLASALIEHYWRWNYVREQRQTEIGEAVFVPKVFFYNFQDELHTGVAWYDGLPILIPKVDLILVPRKELVPRRFLRSAKEDIVLFTWKEMEPFITRFRNVEGPPTAYELFYEETPSNIAGAIRAKNPQFEMPEGLGFDQVLNRELVEAARRSNR